jgi:hypothetical protein
MMEATLRGISEEEPQAKKAKEVVEVEEDEEMTVHFENENGNKFRLLRLFHSLLPSHDPSFR